jgi:flavorubredoxin
VALIDTVKHTEFGTYIEKLHHVLGSDRRPDYLIVNHMEGDHSGAIKLLLEVFPDLRIVGNKRTAEFLAAFYGVTDNVHVVADGDSLDLGCRRLQFFLTPMVHWPETMMTFEPTDGILFSGDAFGGFGALEGGIFDDEVDLAYFENEILRYFSNIVGKYTSPVQRAFAKLKGLDVRIIAATHGPVWRKDPKVILDMYDRWSRHVTEEGVVVVYGSMYGNTERMMTAIMRGLAAGGCIKVRTHNISHEHVSFIIADLWRFRGLVLGAPTYNTRLFPPLEYLVQMIENKAMKSRYLGAFGNYTWSGGAVKRLRALAESDGWSLVEPVVEARSCPTADDLEQCFALGRRMAEAVKTPPGA